MKGRSGAAAAAVLFWLAAELAFSQPFAELARQRGLQPVEPPRPAPDFNLPRLDGGSGSLAEYRGRWVVLTFWATWCGPCRVEMPTLERLHRQREAAGLAVLGISLDARREEAREYAEEIGLSFPQFWDQRGEAARVWRADSIPLSYVIDPRGAVVAMSRGARDWTELTPLLDAAIAGAGAAEAAAPSPLGEPMALDAVLEPPDAEVALPRPSVQAGEQFELEVRLRWAGDFEDYVPRPPRVELPEGVELEGTRASSSSLDGRSVVTYRLTLRAAESGSYSLGPVELSYTPRLEATPLATRLQGPTVEVVERSYAGLRAGQWSLMAAVAALLAASALALGVLRERSRVRRPAADSGCWRDELARHLTEARRKRLAGDGTGCVLELATVAAELARRDGEESGNWEEMAERARYAGQAPPPEALERLETRLRRGLEPPDPALGRGRSMMHNDTLRVEETR